MVSATAVENARWLRWLPGWQVLRGYQRSWLRQDVVAGLVLTSMLLPVGLAYAQASGLPGICGLYATIVPLLAYAIFGPSRILVLGPDSALAAVILAVVLPLSEGDSRRAITIASAMALVSVAIRSCAPDRSVSTSLAFRSAARAKPPLRCADTICRRQKEKSAKPA